MQSLQRVVSDGTLQIVDLSITYFDRSEINVFVNVEPYTDWHWASDVEDRIIFNSPIPAGVEVLIKRTTDLSKLRHYFSKGSAFTAEALDEDLQQVLHIAQEATEDNPSGDFFKDIDMHGYRVKNIGQAVDDSDALTLRQYKQDAQGAFVARNQAEQFKNEAASYASSAQTSANNSAASAQDSLAAAGNAQTYAADAAQSATNAAVSASAAAQSETNAAVSASAAAQSETNAAASASAAAQSATNAAASASAAAQSATNAAASASAAAASFDAFDDRYLGAKASDPTTDNDGNALQVGALYWNTTTNELRVWNGSSWQVPAGSLVENADMVNMDHTAIMQALGLVRMAHTSIDALRYGPYQQQGEIVIRNRGVVSGCAITKSTSAARNLSISSGACFARGATYPVVEGNNAASVPANTSGTMAVAVSAYLYPHSDGQTYRLAVTAIGQSVPEDGIEIYRLTIPAGSTDATDPYLANVTLTDVRRIEPSYPKLLDSPPSVSLAFTRPMRGTDWRMDIDVVSSASAPCRADQIVITNRATNGCTLTLASAADDVRIRWQTTRLHD